MATGASLGNWSITSRPRYLGRTIFGLSSMPSLSADQNHQDIRAVSDCSISKVRIDGGEPVRVRDDNAIGCQTAPDGSALYYAKILTQATGAWDFELRRAAPEDAPSTPIGRVSGARVPATAINFHALLSPDGQWLAMPLLDGSTTNIWALSTTGGGWRKLIDFGERNVTIARRINWSNDGRYMYASVSDVDSDIVILAGLR
jgi:hypothetical protein